VHIRTGAAYCFAITKRDIWNQTMNQFIDNYCRQITYLRVSVTDRCNLRCIYCMPEEGVSLIGHDDILSYEEIVRIAGIVAPGGISKIRITGGEPLVRKGITGLVTELRSIPGITDISMTTNGILLQAAARELRKAGLQRINISLDTLNPDKYRHITRGGDIRAVLSGISEAHKEGFSPIKINVVAMRGINDDEILAFAELTAERPVHVRFIEFMPISGTMGPHRDCFISNAEIKDTIKNRWSLISRLPDKNPGPAQMFQIEGASGRLGFISPLSNHFCKTCNRLRLTCDGKLRTCLFSDTETDLKTSLRSGADDDELRKIITGAVLTKPKQHLVLQPSFKKCRRGMSTIGG